jgi:4-hydroxybenzoate polyprenyltransferase
MLVIVFMIAMTKPFSLLMWMVGISLGCFYSIPPLRIKARSWLASVTLILVLAIFPILFAYFTFSSKLNPVFLLALIGLALTVYGVIIPTEIRDYFGDKAMGIKTMTVHLGLVKASLLSIILLSIGGVFIGSAFFFTFAFGKNPLLSLLVFIIAGIDLIVLRKLKKLLALSKEYEKLNSKNLIAQEIIGLSENNPKWIMLVTQTYSFLSIVMLIHKFF